MERVKKTCVSLLYFGARYYNSDISVWLSVDPMSDARPGLSPYNYCQWNPVVLGDPNGMLDEEVDLDIDLCPWDLNGYFEDFNTISDCEFFEENTSYKVKGTKVTPQINYERGSTVIMKTFTYKGKVYEAGFNPKTGEFSGYYNSDDKKYIPKTSNFMDKVDRLDRYCEGADSPVGKVLYEVSATVNDVYAVSEMVMIVATGEDGLGEEYNGFKDRVAIPIVTTTASYIRSKLLKKTIDKVF